MNTPATQSGIGLAGKALLISAALVLVIGASIGIWWVMGSIGSGNEELELQKLGAFQLGVEGSPAAPGVGDNDLKIQIKDTENRPVRDAEIEAVVFMSQMGSMPYMESRPEMAETEPGMYVGTYNLVMGGSWNVDISIRNRDVSG